MTLYLPLAGFSTSNNSALMLCNQFRQLLLAQVASSRPRVGVVKNNLLPPLTCIQAMRNLHKEMKLLEEAKTSFKSFLIAHVLPNLSCVAAPATSTTISSTSPSPEAPVKTKAIARLSAVDIRPSMLSTIAVDHNPSASTRGVDKSEKSLRATKAEKVAERMRNAENLYLQRMRKGTKCKQAPRGTW
jgi:hypothetical protein